MSNAFVIKGVDFSDNALTQVELSNVIPCTGISLSDSTISVTSLDSTSTLTATVLPADCTETVIWSTSNSAVATVSGGVITFTGLGTATITATCGDYSATCAVTVDNVVVQSGFVFGIVEGANDADYASFTYPSYKRIALIDLVPTDTTRLRLSLGSGTQTDYYGAPHKIPAGTARVKIESNNLSDTYSCYIWCFNSQEAASGKPLLAKALSKNTYNATSFSLTAITNVPQGADSIACFVYTRSTYTADDDPDAIAVNIGYKVTFMTAE